MNAYHQQIADLRVLARTSHLDAVVERFLESLAMNPDFHLDSRPEQASVLEAVVSATLTHLTGTQHALRCELLRCEGTDLIHGVCVGDGYLLYLLFFEDDRVGVVSAVICPPGQRTWNARIRFDVLAVGKRELN